MTAISKDRIEEIIGRGCTSADVQNAIGTLTEEAIAGDPQARRLLHAVDFQQQLSKAMIGDIKRAILVLGLPIAPVACIAAAIASTLEAVGLEVAPTIHKEFDEVRADLAATPQIIADREKAHANFKARIEFADALKAEGLDGDEIKRRVAELYNAQLKDFVASNEREEALAS